MTTYGCWVSPLTRFVGSRRAQRSVVCHYRAYRLCRVCRKCSADACNEDLHGLGPCRIHRQRIRKTRSRLTQKTNVAARHWCAKRRASAHALHAVFRNVGGFSRPYNSQYNAVISEDVQTAALYLVRSVLSAGCEVRAAVAHIPAQQFSAPFQISLGFFNERGNPLEVCKR